MAHPSEISAPSLLPSDGGFSRSVRVAVIDSGVNPRHPHICGLAGGIVIGENSQPEPGDHSDYLGHGTAVTAAIQEKAPDADYFAVRLFQTSLRTTTDALFNAIDWAIAERMDVINLSLGTRNPAQRARFQETIARACEEGVLLVAARQAGDDLCYPGSLPGTISVGLDWDCPRERFRYVDQAAEGVFYASGFPRDLPGMTRERNLNGISFAVANMCGFVIKACEPAVRDDFRGREKIEAVRRTLVASAMTTSPEP
ncbi:MAG: S8 family serine peptidase [Bryobacteraceae bacterium]